MLNWKYSPKQWVCLVVIAFCVAFGVVSEQKETTTAANRPTQSLAVELIAVVVAFFLLCPCGSRR